MRLPRMTTRRWMVAVAVFALSIGVGVQLHHRRAAFLSRAQIHSEQAAWRLADSVTLCGRAIGNMDDIELASLKRRINILPQLVAYHRAQDQKYRRAARYPWLPVEPDPPAPE